jgi:hypothetical protein
MTELMPSCVVTCTLSSEHHRYPCSIEGRRTRMRVIPDALPSLTSLAPGRDDLMIYIVDDKQ